MLAFCLAVPAAAQTPSDVKDGSVAVIGENPGIRLVVKDGAPPATSVSFWRVFHEPFVIESRAGMPHNPYLILSTFIPARAAEVVINGRRAAGNPTPRMRGTRQSSSAFLAFAETWLK